MSTDNNQMGQTAILIAGIVALWKLFEKLVNQLISKYGKNGKTESITHKTFADDEDRYWRKMREVVTEPIAEVLKGTNNILGELRDRAIWEDGAEDRRKPKH